MGLNIIVSRTLPALKLLSLKHMLLNPLALLHPGPLGVDFLFEAAKTILLPVLVLRLVMLRRDAMFGDK